MTSENTISPQACGASATARLVLRGPARRAATVHTRLGPVPTGHWPRGAAPVTALWGQVGRDVRSAPYTLPGSGGPERPLALQRNGGLLLILPPTTDPDAVVLHLHLADGRVIDAHGDTNLIDTSKAMNKLLLGIILGVLAGVVAAIAIPRHHETANANATATPSGHPAAPHDQVLRVGRPESATQGSATLRPVGAATIEVTAHDPHGGPDWAVRVYRGVRVLTPRFRRAGTDGVIAHLKCAQLGRIHDGRFGWLDARGTFRRRRRSGGRRASSAPRRRRPRR